MSKKSKGLLGIYKPRNKSQKKHVNAVNRPNVWWQALMKDPNISEDEKKEWVMKAVSQLVETIAGSSYSMNDHSRTTIDDLIQSGWVGVYSAFPKYNGSTQPNTFFGPYIVDAVCQEIHGSRNYDKRQMKDLRTIIASQEKATKDGYDWTPEMCSRETGISVAQIKQLLKLKEFNNVDSLDREEHSQVEDSLLSADPEKVVLKGERTNEILEAISSLNKIERVILLLHAVEGKSLTAIKQMLNERSDTPVAYHDVHRAYHRVQEILQNSNLAEYLEKKKGGIDFQSDRLYTRLSEENYFDDIDESELLEDVKAS